jgi:hypothetical protein
MDDKHKIEPKNLKNFLCLNAFDNNIIRVEKIPSSWLNE